MVYFIVDTIFISIAACKEEFLAQTIKSAMSNADHPELLYFGISNMVIDQEDFVTDPVFNQPNVQCIEIKHKEALGTGFGRMTASLIADRDHTYLLQVDAQNIFEKGWDTELKNYYTNILKLCDKPIISSCPTRWVEGPNKEIFLYEDNGPIVNPYNFKTEQTFSSLGIKIYDRKSSNNDGVFTKYASIEGHHREWSDKEDFVEHGLIHASFMFTSFSFIREVMHDPGNPWDGDQINLSLRAGTRGYRMFGIKNCIVWSKDKYNRSGKLLSDYDWRKVKRGPIGLYNEKKSRAFQKKIFSGEYLGYWGAPTKESIDLYYKSMGTDLSKYFI
jgi:hypothetical protein